MIQKLPVELKQNLLNIKSLDEKAQELCALVEEGLHEVVTSAKAGKKPSKSVQLTKLREDLSKAFDLSEEKIGLAAQTYETVLFHSIFFFFLLLLLLCFCCRFLELNQPFW